MNTIDAIHMIKDLGFPVMVAIWCLFRIERRMDLFNNRQHDLVVALKVIAKTIDADID